ncbi:hypothetical protein FA95DRAFT_1598479 [Auriscalpium vulgare]|uniref:Uncharacterized protein n=1 Tax=Auriscalpium vulgare TaxID=40419 RepID=A0ACB8REF7_9AGAM|nr:hypothetical protein FA95DRAFT_1598479 [Auriscalpium vulgare]
MSRRSAHMPPPPPPDRDILMGPPPVPHQQPFAPSNAENASQRDYAEKYYKLKRKYFDLEDRHKRTEEELRLSGERNMHMSRERGLLLDRIIELETIASAANPESAMPLQPPSSAFPRSLISNRAQNAFAANLRQAIDEIAAEDPRADAPHPASQSRKRPLDDAQDRSEEDPQDSRKSARRSKGASAAPPANGYVPPADPAEPSGAQPKPLVTTSGKRIRIKPPVPVAPEQQQQQQAPPPHPAAETLRAQYGAPALLPRPTSPASPLSPIASDGEHYHPRHPDGVDFRNGGVPPISSPGLVSESPASLRATAAALPPTSIQRFAKPKRLKAHTVTSKSFSIPMVPRDAHGRPVLPLNVGIMTVISLGEICMREHFHTERYIFPVGYQVQRRYLSANDPSAEVVYNCRILDGGDGPKFQITAADKPDEPIIAGTATGAWSVVVRAANHVRNRQHSNSVSGPDFFGLGQNTIKHLIQELHGADRLKDYVWQKFQEGGSARPLGGRHAAVIPALPEDYGSPPSGTHGHGHERGDSRDSMSGIIEGNVSDVRGMPPEDSRRAARRGSRSSNGPLPDDLPPPPAPYGRHAYAPPPHAQEPAGYAPHLSPAHHHARAHEPPRPHMSPPTPTHHAPSHHASPHPNGQAYHHHTRSRDAPPYRAARSPAESLSLSPPARARPPPSPYAETPPPPRAVPPTFAGIMNAYPAEPYSPRPGSGSDREPGSSRGSASGSGDAERG